MRKINYPLLLIFLFPVFLSHSQRDSIQERQKRNGEFSVGFMPLMSNSVSFSNTVGANLIKSKPTMGGEINVGYNHFINDKWKFRFRYGMGFQPVGITGRFDNFESSKFPVDQYPTLEVDMSESHFGIMNSIYTKSQFSFERLMFQKNNHQIHLGAGLQFIRYIFNGYNERFSSSYYIDESNPNQLLFTSVVDDDKRWPIYLSLQMDMGYTYAFKNLTKVRTSLFLNYSPIKRAEGYYHFHNLGADSYGTFKYGISFLGLNVEYLFGQRKKK